MSLLLLLMAAAAAAGPSADPCADNELGPITNTGADSANDAAFGTEEWATGVTFPAGVEFAAVQALVGSATQGLVIPSPYADPWLAPSDLVSGEILGMTLSVDAKVDVAGSTPLRVVLRLPGGDLGTAKTLSHLTTSRASYDLGDCHDLWGLRERMPLSLLTDPEFAAICYAGAGADVVFTVYNLTLTVFYAAVVATPPSAGGASIGGAIPSGMGTLAAIGPGRASAAAVPSGTGSVAGAPPAGRAALSVPPSGKAVPS